MVTTIHQPSSRLFNKFDKLILLGKGSSLYFGKASEAMAYFSYIGFSPLIAMNPAEFLIDLANGNVNDKSIPWELDDKIVTGSRDFRDGRSTAPMDLHEVNCLIQFVHFYFVGYLVTSQFSLGARLLHA